MVEKLISVIQKRNFRTHFGIGNLENNWANEITMTEYVNICPCVAESRKEYDLPLDLKRFLVFERSNLKKLHKQAANYGFICQ